MVAVGLDLIAGRGDVEVKVKVEPLDDEGLPDGESPSSSSSSSSSLDDAQSSLGLNFKAKVNFLAVGFGRRRPITSLEGQVRSCLVCTLVGCPTCSNFFSLARFNLER